MPGQILSKTAKLWVQISPVTTVAHNEAGIHVNHMLRIKGCDAQNLQI